MTAQFPDTFLLRGHHYALAGVEGSSLFDPLSLGLHPTSTCTACWRGYVCAYGLRQDRLVLANLHISLRQSGDQGLRAQRGPAINGVQPSRPRHALFSDSYEGLDLPVQFSGGMLVGEGFIHELYVHMGFHPAWKYKTVLELLFDGGRLLEERDVSQEMAELRARKAGQPLRPGIEAGPEELHAWIASTFRLDYSL